MPKRKQDESVTAPSPRPVKVPGSPKNKERAYIAASRRADRKLEDRIRSAELASQVHKERTGRGFRITEEIVLRQEMYEEEDDNLPRSYLLLGSHLQTPSHEMNRKVDAYLTNKMAMSALIAKSAEDWRSNEINQLFEKSFPHATAQAQQLTSDMKKSPVSTPSQGALTSPSLPDTSGRPQSVRAISSTLAVNKSPPPQTPASQQSITSGSAAAEMEQPSFDDCRLTERNSSMPPFTFGDESSFTAELPNEVKLFMSGTSGSDNPFVQGFFDPNKTSYAAPYDTSASLLDMTDPKSQTFTSASKQDASGIPGKGQSVVMDSFPDASMGNIDPSLQWDIPSQTNGDEPSWDAFIHEGAWGVNEQS